MYEIPQKLQYEEKIIFNLTFRQLAYALIFGLPAMLIFTKTSLSIYIKVPIALILAGIASLFMFFNLSGNLRNILHWMKFRIIYINDRKMHDFIGIEKIEKGVIYAKR